MKARFLVALTATFTVSSGVVLQAEVVTRRVAETEHFTHHAYAGARTDAKRRERRLRKLEEALQVEVSGRVEYFAYERPEQVEAATGHYLAGLFVSYPRQIHATPEAEGHEIVHLVSHELGDPGPFFGEGLAVALGNEGRLGGWPVDRIARGVVAQMGPEVLEARFASLQTSWKAVAAAGSFVKWLERRYGLPRLAAFFRACGRSGRPVAFEATFGGTLAGALQAWARDLGVPTLAQAASDPTLAQMPSSAATSMPVAETPGNHP